MPKRCLCLLSLLLVVCSAAAQQFDEAYYPYAEPEERTPLIATDTALFFRAVQSAPDLYGELTDFNLPAVALKRRGQDYRYETVSVGGVGVSYRYSGALRLLGAAETYSPGLAPADITGTTGGVRNFSFTNDLPLLPYSASVRFTDRNYLFGAKVTAAGELGRGWSGSAAIDARTGRDIHVEGVFTNALTAGFRLTKHFGEGHELALLAVVPPSVKGTRLSSVEEAFSLTGERLYNPAWGFQDGRVRNSRVRRELVPLAILAYKIPLTASTSLTAAFGAEFGVRKYSALGWYDARTPVPDNYRYLPGYTGDRENELAWRNADPSYTQIDWDGMIAQNRMAAGYAVYALEDRVERLRNLDFSLLLTSAPDERLTLRYGGFYRSGTIRSYKQMRDLLGAQQIVDIDQYLVDDDTFGNRMQNDLRHPGRVIRTGDRFGYDYALTLRRAGVCFGADYRSDRLRAEVAVTLEDAAALRRGYYEKELFPGDGSFGRSRRMKFTPYTVKVLAGWAFSPRRYLEFSALAAAVVPDPEELFYQPLYNNRTVDDPISEHLYAAEANYSVTGRALDMRITVFVTASFDGIQTQRYFDDMAGVYADVATTGIGRMAYGLEAAAGIRLSYRWRLSLAASAGRYKYIRNPHLTVLSDVDNTAVDRLATSYMGDCEAGGAPQLTVCVGAGYFGPKGWGLRLSSGYASRRYVEPMPLRRTERIARQGGITPEAFDAFTRQERLGDAFTLDAALFKTFWLGRSRLMAALMLRNLTGGQPVYSGYESSRIMRRRAGDSIFWQPQATRYTHVYPRSFYLTVSYTF